MLMIHSDFFPEHETAKFGVLIADFESVYRCFEDRISRYEMGFYFEAGNRTEPDNIVPKWMSEKKYSLRDCKFQLCGNDSKCFYFCNLADSWNSLFYGVVYDLKCDAFFLRSSPDKASKAELIQSFDVYRSGDIIRSVQVFFDQKWVFHSSGELLDVEHKFPYHLREKRNRLDRSNIMDIFREFVAFPELKGPFKVREWGRHCEVSVAGAQ